MAVTITNRNYYIAPKQKGDAYEDHHSGTKRKNKIVSYHIFIMYDCSLYLPDNDSSGSMDIPNMHHSRYVTLIDIPVI